MRQQIDEFFAAGGDRLRTEGLNLDPHSVVFDLGGYLGGWANKIHELYRPRVCVFEPVKAFADRIRASVPADAHVTVYDYGLGPRNERVRMNMAADGTSVSGTADDGDAEIRSVVEFMFQLEPRGADLTKINIEGSEYDLLDCVLANNLAPNLGDIVVQFHKHVPDAERRLLAIREGLSKTHVQKWCYDFVWEYWELKEGEGAFEDRIKASTTAGTRAEIERSRARSRRLRDEYYERHALCPKCGSAQHSSTYAGYIMDASNPGAYKDLNETRCSACGYTCTTHERVGAPPEPQDNAQ